MASKKKAVVGGGPAAKKAKKQNVKTEVEDEDCFPTQEELKKHTVATLRDTCTELGLDTKGTKDALIQRILDHHHTEDKSAPSGVKKTKRESKNTKFLKVIDALKKVGTKSKFTTKVDQEYAGSAKSKVHEDHACTLNQSNIGQNNNKFYIIQMIEENSGKKGPVYHVFTRWGRVGETGQKSTSAALTLEKAVKEFEKKYKDKTKNNWEDRADFVAQKGKYTLLEIEDDDGGDTEVMSRQESLPCTLDRKTKHLVEMLFDKEMFTNAMLYMELDIRKMPLGKLSKIQISRGFEALMDIEDAIKAKKGKQVLAELSSKFYTLIPHNFGRTTPTVLDTKKLIQEKKDVMIVLSDIELAQSLQKAKAYDEKVKSHPVDVNYNLLDCNLRLLDTKSKEYEVIKTYQEKTRCTYFNSPIKDIWAVERNGEAKRFSKHDSIKERKLLWHGTNFAVVAAILSSGLRIMPDSGGRVGRGIYFASENKKSADYVLTAPTDEGIMFLNEVVLGKEHTITQDNPYLKKAPKGFHSVVARGQTEPDPKLDTTIKIDGKKVVVPQGPPIDTEFKDSEFDQSEYLVYDESQVRIRYLLMIQMYD